MPAIPSSPRHPWPAALLKDVPHPRAARPRAAPRRGRRSGLRRAGGLSRHGAQPQRRPRRGRHRLQRLRPRWPSACCSGSSTSSRAATPDLRVVAPPPAWRARGRRGVDRHRRGVAATRRRARRDPRGARAGEVRGADLEARDLRRWQHGLAGDRAARAAPAPAARAPVAEPQELRPQAVRAGPASRSLTSSTWRVVPTCW